MNILYIEHYAGSVSMGMEFRPYYMCREWQKAGHKVRIIAADYSHLRTKQPEVSGDFSISQVDGVTYQFVKTGTYNGNGAKRAMTMFRFTGKLWMRAGRLAEEFKPDAVITSSTYPLDAYAGYRIAKKAGAKFIHEAHDVWPETLIELGGMSRKHPFIRLLDRAEKYAYRKSEKVVSLLPGVLPHLMEQGMQREDKFAYIPNGIVLEDWNNTTESGEEYTELFDRLHREGRFVVLYLGGHALSNALDQLLDAAKITKDVSFILVGKGVEKSRLQKRDEDENIDNIHFLPPVSKKQVPSVLKMADALYIGAAHSPLYRFGVSMNKLYDYMMSGRPVLNGVVASNNEVEEAGCGLSFDSSKPKEIAVAISQMKQMTAKERKALGENGHQWVIEHCDYTKLAEQFLTLMKT